jgi:hypothetical protein
MTATAATTTRASLILGLGTGRCGTHSLTELLNRQPDSLFTHEELPILHWKQLPGRPGIAERIRRIRRSRSARFIGDVALFYLPYVEEIIALEPDVRLICLERPRDQVVSSFCKILDSSMPLPTDHWSAVPADGWYHDPAWTPMFPQYDLSDRQASLERYWDDYHARSVQFADRYPQHFRIFSTDMLNDPSGVRELLTFAGIPDAEQARETGVKMWPAEVVAPHARRGVASNPDPRDPCHCAVLVPAATADCPGCEAALRALERRGYEVRRADDADSFDIRCNRLASSALSDGFLETMWIGPDIVFDPDDVERLRAHQLPIACGVYPRPDRQTLDCHFMESTKSVTLGQSGGLTEILHAGLRFLLVHRKVYTDLVSQNGLPVCDQASAFAFFPFFQPLVSPLDDGYRWLDSEFAFSEFARRCGYRIYADTSIRLYRQTSFLNGWEEAGRQPERFANYHLHL